MSMLRKPNFFIAAGALFLGIAAWIGTRQFTASAENTTVCASNLRQLGQAMLAYAQDYDETLPAPNEHGHGGWNDIDLDTGANTLDPYVPGVGKTTKIWACSSLKGPASPPAKGDEWYFLAFKRSYAMNAYLRGPGSTARGGQKVDDVDAASIDTLRQLPFGIRSEKIFVPKNTVLLYEGIPVQTPAGSSSASFNGFVRSDGNWTSVAGYWPSASECAQSVNKNGRFADETCQDKGLNPWHGKLNNYLYCDGHVKAHAPVQEGWTPTASDTGDFFVRHCRDPKYPCP